VYVFWKKYVLPTPVPPPEVIDPAPPPDDNRALQLPAASLAAGRGGAARGVCLLKKLE